MERKVRPATKVIYLAGLSLFAVGGLMLVVVGFGILSDHLGITAIGAILAAVGMLSILFGPVLLEHEKVSRSTLRSTLYLLGMALLCTGWTWNFHKRFCFVFGVTCFAISGILRLMGPEKEPEDKHVAPRPTPEGLSSF